MSQDINQEEFGRAIQTMLPNVVFKSYFQSAVDSLLPELGDDSLMPKLLLIHMMSEVYTGKETDHAIEFYSLGFNDFNEMRHEHIEKIGFRVAVEEKRPLMVCLASECWYSEQKLQSNGEKEYQRAGEDPNRKEGIIIAAKTIDGRSASAITIVERDAEERFVKFDNLRIAYSIDSDDIMEMGIVDNFWSGYMDEIRRLMDIK